MATKKSKTATKKKTKAKAAGGKTSGVLRVRMYRIGFGDFFLLTVPTTSGPQHILIDCGVHAGNIGTMDACVQDLIKETDRKLALVIATHYHADHLSGFASNFTDFEQFEVGAVWIPNRLDPNDSDAVNLQHRIASVASRLLLQLGARKDPDGIQAFEKVQNALGVQLGAREGGNAKALRLLTSGFKNKPPVYYYEAGDTAVLPDVLKGAITAEILGPSPKSEVGTYTASDNRKEQYLAAVEERGLSDLDRVLPFEKDWPASAADYPPEVFRPFRRDNGAPPRPKDLEDRLKGVQPDVLAAAADAIDGTLNNQSLVVLFTCEGKKLLFVGDAQWGNWESWLYGRRVSGKDPGISQRARDILGSIDFYKVGHHGSTNSTPIPAVGAMSEKCVAMCSTETGYPDRKRPYGDPERDTEVPRTTLMKALHRQTKNKLVRSDWLEVDGFEAAKEARDLLPKLPKQFSAGDGYIDYIFAD